MPNTIQILRSNTALARPIARQQGEIYVNYADRQLGVVDAVATDLIAVRFFSTLALYVIGDYALFTGLLYKCIAPTGPGAFDPAAWAKVEGGAAIGDNPPANPQNGDLWWDSVSGQLYIYYDDGTSQQWVIANNFGGGGDFLPLTGGTLTGDLYRSGIAGTNRGLFGATGNLTRWELDLGDNNPETGLNNAGSEFSLRNYADDGSYIATPLSVERATGNMTIRADLNVTGTINGVLIGQAPDEDIGAGFLTVNATWPLIVTTGLPPSAPFVTFTIPPDKLPNNSFYWTIQGNGLGEVFVSNMGYLQPVTSGTAIVVQTYDLKQQSGTGSDDINWAILVNSFNITAANNTREVLARGTVTNNFVFLYDPVLYPNGIQFRLKTGTTVPITNYTILFGIELKIIKFADAPLPPFVAQQPFLPPPPPPSPKIIRS